MQLKEIKKYFTDGKLWYHYFLDEQGICQGKYISYYVDGIISDEANYKDNKYHGKLIDYCRDGAINYIKYYWNGKEVTKAEFLKLKLESIQ